MFKLSDLINRETGFFHGETEDNNVISILKKICSEKANKTVLNWPDHSKLPAFGDDPVKIIEHSKISFGKFYELITRTANGLKNCGIERGDRVVLFVPMSLYLYQIMFAINMIGASAVFLDSWARRNQLGVSAKIVSPKAMISFEKAFLYCSDEDEISKIPIKIVAGQHDKEYDASIEDISRFEPLDKIQPVRGDETALITFTTGSSGVPKGADRTHQFLCSQRLALGMAIPYEENDIDLPAFPIFSLNNLGAGVETVIPVTDIGNPTEKDGVMLASQILSQKVTCATLSPSMLKNLAAYCDRKNIVMPLLRRVVTGGAPVSNEVLELFRKCAPLSEVWVLYGSTEVEPIAHIEAKEILSQKKTGSDETEGVNVGHFADGLIYKFIRISKDPVVLRNGDWVSLEAPKGEYGELVVSGLHVCKSYYNDEEAVRKTKITEPDGTVWHRTGDVGKIDEGGNLWLAGRVHNTILRDGKLLFPVKAEIIMKKNPAVKHAAYIGISDPVLGEKAVGVISLNDDFKDKVDQTIISLTTDLLSQDVIFDKLVAVYEIPLDPRHHSKVEYGILRNKLIGDGLV